MMSGRGFWGLSLEEKGFEQGLQGLWVGKKQVKSCLAGGTQVVCLYKINKLHLVYALRDPPIFSKIAFFKKIVF